MKLVDLRRSLRYVNVCDILRGKRLDDYISHIRCTGPPTFTSPLADIRAPTDDGRRWHNR